MKIHFKALVAGASLMLGASMSWAYPTLQLDASSGVYVYGTTESTVVSANSFTLYALFDGSKGAIPSGTFYISAAITPKIGPTAVDFGSFTINGTTYSSSVALGNPGYMQYGGPPVDSLFPDLPYHGIFNTFYAEVPLVFSLSSKANAYDVQTQPGVPVLNPAGEFYYHSFTVDVSNMGGGYNVHFDLYDEIIHGKKKSVMFAPFSHDVETNHRVPDGGMTLAFLGISVTSLLAFRRKLA